MDENLIRKQLLFAGLSDPDIAWLTEKVEFLEVKGGDLLMQEGTFGNEAFIVLDGEFKVTKRSGDSEVVIATRGAGELLGELALIEQTCRGASVYALKDSKLYKISRDIFIELISTRPGVTFSILHTVIARLRNTESVLLQSMKMASLGTLAAGLAHELNNPAAAARRSSAQLHDLLTAWQELTLQLSGFGLNDQQAGLLDLLSAEMAKKAGAVVSMDPLTRGDRENELLDWLEGQAIEPAWEIAPVLVACDWNREEVSSLQQHFNPAQFAVVVRWLCYGNSVYRLLHEINISAGRISEIVGAVKSYSYLDQAPLQDVDLHTGLEDTLIILRSRLSPGIAVVRDYTPAPLHIEAYGSELNQVWTNIIDSTIYAMQGKGHLHIKTSEKDGQALVEITDSGPGIPPEIQPRIFDPFFTTKPPGSGAGLGLNIAYNIVQKHRGQMCVFSQPGSTTFQITLPLLFTARSPANMSQSWG